MAIKMIVTDLDRTLLRDDKTISPYTQEALEKLKAQGIPFIVATARPARAVRFLLSFLRFDGAVFFNGAVTAVGEQVVAAIGIENALTIVREILRDHPDTRLSVEMDDYLYSNMSPEELGDWGADYCRTSDFHEIVGRQVEKILISTPEGNAPGWEEKYRPYIPEHLYMQLSEGTLLMVMNRAATKLNGIKVLCGHYGVSLAEVVAFGDDLNDIEMLQGCGTGVAVANALPQVKAAADCHCPSNEEDGVARWLWENVLVP